MGESSRPKNKMEADLFSYKTPLVSVPSSCLKLLGLLGLLSGRDDLCRSHWVSLDCLRRQPQDGAGHQGYQVTEGWNFQGSLTFWEGKGVKQKLTSMKINVCGCYHVSVVLLAVKGRISVESRVS